MQAGRGFRVGQLRSLGRLWPWLLLLLALLGIRLSKGAPLADAYALLSRPFWPGSAQSEWLRSAQQLDQQSQLLQLRSDNNRLRRLLQLAGADNSLIGAAVISRQSSGWGHQLLIGKGSMDGVSAGAAVLAPGGLLGRVASTTPPTAAVQLLSDDGSRVGVWVPRIRRHGLLTGLGTARPVLRFLEKDPGVRPGDVVVTSPASTLVPPNLPVGVIQSVELGADPAPAAVVQLSAPLEAVDWVQVVRR